MNRSSDTPHPSNGSRVSPAAHISVALITVALIAADFGAGALKLPKATQNGWDVSATIGFIGAAVWFIYDAITSRRSS
jgi:hypothetical protein